MTDQTFRARIQNTYGQMTKVERRIADFVINNAEQVPEMTVGQLAASAGTAASGVVRFCKKLGYPGFTAMKISLASQTEPPSEMIMPAVEPGDDVRTVFEKVFSSSIKTLRDTLELIDKAVMEEAVNILSEATRIEFYGVGTSATIAMDAYYRLMRIGYPASFATDSQIMRISAAQLRQGQVAVGISHSGRAVETIDALELARACGARTIALTSTGKSPICRSADLVLQVYSDESRYPIEAVSARIAHIAVLDALCVSLAMKHTERTAEKIRTMNSLFDKLRRK